MITFIFLPIFKAHGENLHLLCQATEENIDFCFKGYHFLPEEIESQAKNYEAIHQSYVSRQMRHFLLNHLVQEKVQHISRNPQLKLKDHKEQGVCFDEFPDLHIKSKNMEEAHRIKNQGKRIAVSVEYTQSLQKILKNAITANRYFEIKNKFQKPIERLDGEVLRITQEINLYAGKALEGENFGVSKIEAPCGQSVSPTCTEIIQDLSKKLPPLILERDKLKEESSLILGTFDNFIRENPAYFSQQQFIGPIPVINLEPSKLTQGMMAALDSHEKKKEIMEDLLDDNLNSTYDLLPIATELSNNYADEKLKDIDDAINSVCENKGHHIFDLPNVGEETLNQLLKDNGNNKENIQFFIGGYCLGLDKRRKSRKTLKTINYISTGILLIGVGIVATPFSSLALAGTLLAGTGTAGGIASSTAMYQDSLRKFQTSKGLAITEKNLGGEYIKSLNDLSEDSKLMLVESLSLVGAQIKLIPKLAGVTKVSFKSQQSFRGIEGAAEIEKVFGVSIDVQSAFKRIAQKFGAEIKIRPVNPHAIKLRSAGHPPKPPFIKSKTINYIDNFLGASPADIGKVGFFKPKLPNLSLIEDPKMQKALIARYEQRLQEFNNLNSRMSKLEKSGKIKIEGGVVKQGSDNMAYTGDIDIFQITKTDGSKLSKAQMKEILEELAKPPIKIQHPAHLDWRTLTYDDKIMRSAIIRGHKQEPILSFTAADEIVAKTVK